MASIPCPVRRRNCLLCRNQMRSRKHKTLSLFPGHLGTRMRFCLRNQLHTILYP